MDMETASAPFLFGALSEERHKIALDPKGEGTDFMRKATVDAGLTRQYSEGPLGPWNRMSQPSGLAWLWVSAEQR